jgi:hypothetical protein
MPGVCTSSSSVSALLLPEIENTVWPSDLDTRLVLLVTSLANLFATDTQGLLIQALSDRHYDMHPQFGDNSVKMADLPWIFPPHNEDLIIESEGGVTLFTRMFIVLWAAEAFGVRAKLAVFDKMEAAIKAFPQRLAGTWATIEKMSVKDVHVNKLADMIKAISPFAAKFPQIDAGRVNAWKAKHDQTPAAAAISADLNFMSS